MSSNVLSRFLPPNDDSPSIYEAIREHDAGSDSSDVEERAGMTAGENAEDYFTDQELEDALADARDSDVSSPDAALLGPRSAQKPPDRGSPSVSRRRKPSRPRWMAQASSPGYELDEHDEDVPPSLLVEGQDDEDLKSRLPPPPQMMPSRSRTPSPQPSPQPHRPHWEERRDQRFSDTDTGPPWKRWLAGQHHHLGLANADPKKIAMWRWANIDDLDNFLKDVYTYFLGNGFWSILLSRALNLLYVPLRSWWDSLVNHAQDFCFRGGLHDVPNELCRLS